MKLWGSGGPGQDSLPANNTQAVSDPWGPPWTDMLVLLVQEVSRTPARHFPEDSSMAPMDQQQHGSTAAHGSTATVLCCRALVSMFLKGQWPSQEQASTTMKLPAR